MSPISSFELNKLTLKLSVLLHKHVRDFIFSFLQTMRVRCNTYIGMNFICQSFSSTLTTSSSKIVTKPAPGIEQIYIEFRFFKYSDIY